MAEQNPYAAPQANAPAVKTVVPPVHRRHRQHPWEEPLRTQLADLARHDRAMLTWAALLAVMLLGGGLWIVTQPQVLASAVWPIVITLLLGTVSLLMAISIYRLIARIDDSDSPLFMALAALVPGFNLLLVFYCHHTARDFARDSSIALGWTGITPEEFAAQVAHARELQLASQPPVALPVAEAFEPPLG